MQVLCSITRPLIRPGKQDRASRPEVPVQKPVPTERTLKGPTKQVAQTGRVSPGTSGTPVQVITNLVRLEAEPDTPVWQYDVGIKESDQDVSRTGKKRTRRTLEGREARAVLGGVAEAKQWGNGWVYDDKRILFSTREDLEIKDFVAQVPGSTSPYQVVLKRTSNESLKATDASSPLPPALELAIKATAAASPTAVRLPTGYVSYNSPGSSLGSDSLHKVLMGFRASLSRVSCGLVMGADVAFATVARDGSVMEVLQETMGLKSVDDLVKALRVKRRRDEIGKQLAGLKIQLSYTKRNIVAAGLSEKSAKDFMFELKDGDKDKKVSVADYMKSQYNQKLEVPDLLCVVDKKGSAYPIELCSIVKYQRRSVQKYAKQQAELIRQAAVKPQDRLQKIKMLLQTVLNLADPRAAVAQAFGLKFKDKAAQLFEVTARVLEGPALANVRNVVREGAWKTMPGKPEVFSLAPWKSGAVICFLDKEEWEGRVRVLLDELSKSRPGRVPPDMPILWNAGGGQRGTTALVTKAIAEAKERYGGRHPELLLVLLPTDGNPGDVRSEVKRVALTEPGLAVCTQCINPAKAWPRGAADTVSPQYISNLAIKVNVKLGGVTTMLATPPSHSAPVLGTQSFMVVGIDTSRSGPGMMLGSLSYVGLVGSIDRVGVKYSTEIQVQDGTDDIVVGMKDGMEALLRNWMAGNQTQQPPEVLLVFRDGISESQMDTVLAWEYTAMREACVSIGGAKYKPKITFVIVSKRHNVRFFPKNEDQAHRSGNVMPGTVIDSDIVPNDRFNFYLNSHAGIQGTNRAPRYTVLVDEVGFDADSLERFTYWMCHTYSSCLRTLSLPPPARYAHKAAEIAREMFRANGSQFLSKDWKFSSLPIQQLDSNNSMYYL